LELLAPAVGVPVPAPVGAEQVLVRTDVVLEPAVELVAVLGIEVVPVLGDLAAGVTVGGDDRVPLGRVARLVRHQGQTLGSLDIASQYLQYAKEALGSHRGPALTAARAGDHSRRPPHPPPPRGP